MNSVADQENMMDFSDDEVQVLQEMSVDVLDCEGIPRRMWNTKCVKLYNVDGVLVGEGTIHSLDSKLVLGASGPLGDTHVLVHVSMLHSEVDLPEEHVYSLVAWPIELVHYCHTPCKCLLFDSFLSMETAGKSITLHSQGSRCTNPTWATPM